MATSQIQKHFLMHNIYKRSKNYFDLERMKQYEHNEQISRRKPNYSIQTFDTRVDQSFVNAADTGRKKLQNEITSYKKRYQDEKTQTFTNSDTLYKYISENQDQIYENKGSKLKIKAPDIGKMLPRKGIQIKKTAYNNEDQFNNFFINTQRSKGQLDFTLLSPRSRSSDNHNPQVIPGQINYFQISKTKQKNCFNNSIYKCLFDYSKEGRYAKLSRKKQDNTQPIPIEKQKLNKASQSVYVNPNVGQNEFYLAVGRSQPHQMNFRYNKSNQYFYQGSQNRTSVQEYSSKKRKEDMVGKRLADILKKKKVTDNKNQLCDTKYFNRNSYRKK